jgi:hypothetical protein
MSAKYKSPSFLLPNELNTSANPLNTDGNPATGTGVNSLYSMNFDGSSYISLGDDVPPFNQTTSKFSISFWLYNTAYPLEVNKCIFENRVNWSGGVSYNSGISFESRTNNKLFWLLMYPSSSYNYVTFPQTELNEDEWNHIAIVFDGTQSNYQDRIEIYVNNSPVTLNYPSSNVPTQIAGASAGDEFRIARGAQPNFVGQMDEFCIFSKSLTSIEVSALHNSGTPAGAATVLNLGASAYYPLGEQAQNSGYPLATGNEWQFPNGVLQDYVMDFDGTDYIDLGIPSFLNATSAFTSSLWFNTNDVGTQTTLWGVGGSASQLWAVSKFEDDLIIYGGSNAKYYRKNTLFNVNTWYNLIVVYDGSQVNSNRFKVYLNGDLLTGATVLGSIETVTPSFTTDLNIGRIGYAAASYFNGQISNVAIWNTAITDANQIANIYNNGSPQTSYTVTPQNWWKLNADSVYTPSVPNYTTALDFDGISDYITVNQINLGTTNTISFWYYGETNTYSIILGNDNAPNDYTIYVQNGGLVYYKVEDSSNGSNSIQWYITSVFDDNWHHFAFSRTNTTVNFYIDGNLQTVHSNTLSNNDTKIDTIGAKSVGTMPFKGKLSNVALFNSALSSSQVSTLLNFGTPETNISFDPTAWWKLDDQNAITDYSGNGHTGTNNGATDATTPVVVVPSWKIPSALPTPTINYTTALDFNGNSDYVRVDNFSGVSNSFSVSLWFNLGTSALVQRNFLELMNPSTANLNQRIFISSAGTIIASQNSGAGGAAQLSTSGINDGEWHHLYATISSNGSIKVILDNNSTASGSSSQSFSSAPSTVNIGVNFYNQSDPTAKRQYFLGQMSNVAVYNSALTDSQVATLYNSGQPESAISLSPVGWWKLDTGGSTITDYGSGGNNGTNNGATQVTSDVLTTQPVNGVSTTLPSTALQQSDLQFDSPYSNYSLSFDGNNYINTGTGLGDSLGGSYSGDLTVSMWLKFGSTSAQYGLFYIGDLAGGTSGSFWINTSASKLWVYASNGTAGYINCSISSLNTTDWYNVTCVYKGYDISNSKIYINNTSQTLTTSGNFNYTYDFTGKKTTIADYYTTPPFRGFNGKIDETAIWNTALTEAQVLEIYNNGKPGDLDNFSGTAPISWWRLGENAYFVNNDITLPNSIAGAPNGVSSGTATSMLSADAPGTYANGIGDGLAVTDRVGDAALSVANSQSYNMIPDDKVPYVPGYAGLQTDNVYSMAFDGTDNVFTIDNSTSYLNPAKITISLWFKPTSIVIESAMISSPNVFGLGYHTYAVGVNSVGNIRVYGLTTPGGGFSHDFTTLGTLNLNQWNFVAMTFDETEFVAYLNGSSASSARTGVLNYQVPTGDIEIGRRSGTTNDVVGNIDEVAIFDEALTPDQIKFDLYEATTTGKTADIANNPNLPTPLAWYRMGD